MTPMFLFMAHEMRASAEPSACGFPTALFVFLAATARTWIVARDFRRRLDRLWRGMKLRVELAQVIAEPRALADLPIFGGRIVDFSGERAHRAQARDRRWVGEPANVHLRAANVAAAIFGDGADIVRIGGNV